MCKSGGPEEPEWKQVAEILRRAAKGAVECLHYTPADQERKKLLQMTPSYVDGTREFASVEVAYKLIR